MSFLRKWIKKISAVFAPKPTPAPQPAPTPQPSGPHMSVYYTLGMHMYRRANEDSTVYFLNPSQDIRRKIVDKTGRILHFPGVETEAFWADGLAPKALEPRIRFRTEFKKQPDGRHIMLWQVQPDGRYWADDDGFGMEDDPEIILYSFLDTQGHFTGPFRLYRIGHNYYFHPDGE